MIYIINIYIHIENKPPPGQYRVRLGGYAGAKSDKVKKDINFLMGRKSWLGTIVKLYIKFRESPFHMREAIDELNLTKSEFIQLRSNGHIISDRRTNNRKEYDQKTKLWRLTFGAAEAARMSPDLMSLSPGSPENPDNDNGLPFIKPLLSYGNPERGQPIRHDNPNIYQGDQEENPEGDSSPT
jgi:hypothetical protein